MKQDGKLDYLELSATGGILDGVKAFYASVFGWSFTDYGVTYAAFDEGLDGGFQAEGSVPRPPLPVLYATDIEATLKAVEEGGGVVTVPVFAFPGGRRFHFTDPAGNEMAIWSP
ncbi:MAG: VOC family protein [Rhizobiaceae bacterium]|nr:VOC family protein [Rhizobiaceae bacterium]